MTELKVELLLYSPQLFRTRGKLAKAHLDRWCTKLQGFEDKKKKKKFFKINVTKAEKKSFLNIPGAKRNKY